MTTNPLAYLPAVDTQAVIADLVAAYTAAQATNIGFPASQDFDLTPLAPLLRFMINNLGDPRTDGAYPIHTKAQERAAVAIIADLLRAPADDRWGYVTSGASEGSEHALHLARTRFPDGIVYHSTAAHHSITQIIDRLRMPSLTVRADVRDQIDYDDLADQIHRHRDRPAIIVANIGTGITEAVDDTRRITAVLDSVAMDRRWIHADAALSGIPLALLDPADRPGFDFTDGADSIVVSGHKFLGSAVPYAVVVIRESLRTDTGRPPTYTGSPNSTVTNSRSGLAALALWYVLHTHGPHLQQRAQHCRDLAAYACGQLVAAGINAWRHPHAFTVVLPTPNPAVARKWVLAADGPTSHIICMPGLTHAHIDALITDLAAGTQPTPPPTVDTIASASIPRQRGFRRGLPARVGAGS